MLFISESHFLISTLPFQSGGSDEILHKLSYKSLRRG